MTLFAPMGRPVDLRVQPVEEVLERVARSLRASSLAVPALAERVRRERRRDFESRDGK
ncbi:hypothetical protein [Streptomyces sp. AC558_RSS880]|uniref:hypothetical protein n=1 Tax=Streptomyces sp. AC558_RSS880 TaxID=2823687 RepID=UPI001C22EF29|nr:hypothetical protein [Streptomyces sp. AC558_RSS880]